MRTSTQHSWSEESMINAISAVRQENMSINEASKTFGVPLSTLFRRCKKVDENVTQLAKKQLGRFRPVFTEKQENDLKSHVLSMEKRLFGLTIRDLRMLVYQYANINKIPNNFSKKEEMAGRDWVEGFLKRNQEVSVRAPENTSAARASAFNKVNVGKFFELLGSLMDKYNFPPSAIYNCDETGITTVPNKPSKIIARKGKKQIGTLSSAERGATVTSLICCNAMGQFIPPLVILPRVRRNPSLEIGLPPETNIVYHASGWMQMEIFAPTWINHFMKYARPSPENPVLLILDGHATHVKNLTLLNIARQNNIHILVLPPHTSHRMQPLDVSFMYPLSTFYEQNVKTWLRNHPGHPVTIAAVGGLFGLAYIRAATTQNAMSGFKNTGICPLNPEIFPDELFEPSETTNREIVDIENNRPERDQQSENTANASNVVPEAKTVSDTSTSPVAVALPPALSPVAGPSRINQEVAGLSRINEETPEKLYFSPAELLPIPKVSQPRKIAKRGGKTTIITSSPYLKELKLQKAKKTTPAQKKSIRQVKRKIGEDDFKATIKRKRVPRKTTDYSDDSDSVDEKLFCKDSSSDLSELSDNNGEDVIRTTDIINTEDGTFTLSEEKVQENDFILVELRNDKTNNKKEFIGQILKISNILKSNKDQTFTVKFMRNYQAHKNIFIFPSIDDISDIYQKEIKGKLSSYVHLRYGKIQFN